MSGGLRNIKLGVGRLYRRIRPEVLSASPDLVRARSNHSARRINSLLCHAPAPTSYLEVGVQRGTTLRDVVADVRVGVDPFPKFATRRLPRGLTFHRSTSDEYFAVLDPTARFDVVFLDGLHEWRQTYKDLLSALPRLAAGGAVLIDDTVPADEVSAIPDMARSYALRSERGLPGRPWHGDVWKVVMVMARYHPELRWSTIVEFGNPQTLVWPVSGVVSIAPADEFLSPVERTSFVDEFSGGVPDYFDPSGEAEAIERWLASRQC